MQTIILGDGALGRAVAEALAHRGEAAPRLLGRPRAADARHRPVDLRVGPEGDGAVLDAEVDAVLVDASRGSAVLGNVEAGLDAGIRRFVIATTAWEEDRLAVDAAILGAGASAVVAPNFSLGVVLFGRLVEEATRLFGGLTDFDPYLVEWHRRTKVDRPSGTARELARRIIAAHPRKDRFADPLRAGAPAPYELDVTVIRAGSAPGMHLVGFDAPGETLELRLTARDRSAYAAGVLAAIDWLRRRDRPAGIVPFDPVVVDALLAGPVDESPPAEPRAAPAVPATVPAA